MHNAAHGNINKYLSHKILFGKQQLTPPKISSDKIELAMSDIVISPHRNNETAIILFGFIGNVNSDIPLQENHFNILNYHIEKYSKYINLKFIILCRSYHPVERTHIFTKISEHIIIHNYYIDDNTILNNMTKLSCPFISLVHRLYGFNTMSFFMSLDYCGRILSENKDLIPNNTILFSRFDTFMEQPDIFCHMYAKIINNMMCPVGLLRDENSDCIEDRFFILHKFQLLELLNCMGKIILFVSTREITNTLRNFPEAIIYDYLNKFEPLHFVKNGVLVNNYLFCWKHSTIKIDVKINLNKYSLPQYSTQLGKYISYIKKYKLPFIVCSSDVKLPCFHNTLSQCGLLITPDWNLENKTHCNHFDLTREFGKIIYDHILFKNKFYTLCVDDYLPKNITIHKFPDGNDLEYVPIFVINIENESDVTVAMNCEYYDNVPLFRIRDVNRNICYYSTSANVLHTCVFKIKSTVPIQPPIQQIHHSKLIYHPNFTKNNKPVVHMHINTEIKDKKKLLEISIINNKMILEKQICINITYQYDTSIVNTIDHNISRQTSDVAIMIIGYDRCWMTQLKQLRNIIDVLNADVFIVTYDENFVNAEKILGSHLKFIKRQKLSEHETQVKNIIKSYGHPVVTDKNVFRVFLQYNNLEQCFHNVESYEERHNIKYKYLFKIRQDTVIENITSDLSFIHQGNIYMNSDYLFYGFRDDVKFVCELFTAKFKYYDMVPWNRRIPNYDILFKSILNNPQYIFDKNNLFGLPKNKIATIPIHNLSNLFGTLDWNNDPYSYFINTCKYFYDKSHDINKITMTSLTEFDRIPFMFQCEYFIVDWAMHNNLVVHEPVFFNAIKKL